MSIRARALSAILSFALVAVCAAASGQSGGAVGIGTTPVVIFKPDGGTPAAAAVARCRSALAARGAEIAAVILGPRAAAQNAAVADSSAPAPLLPVVCYVAGTAAFRAQAGAHLPDWGIGAALPGGRVIALDWQRASGGRRGIEEIFLHELTHALLDQGLRGADAPAWFQEGVAMRLSGEWKFVDTVSLVLEGAPPALERLGGPFPASVDWADQAYRVSLLAVEGLQKRFGPDIVPRLVAAAAKEGNFDFGFEDVTGITLDQFAAQFDEGMGNRLGWLVSLTRWPLLFVIMAIVVLIAGARALVRTRRRLADMDEDEPPGSLD